MIKVCHASQVGLKKVLLSRESGHRRTYAFARVPGALGKGREVEPAGHTLEVVGDRLGRMETMSFIRFQASLPIERL